MTKNVTSFFRLFSKFFFKKIQNIKKNTYVCTVKDIAICPKNTNKIKKTMSQNFKAIPPPF